MLALLLFMCYNIENIFRRSRNEKENCRIILNNGAYAFAVCGSGRGTNHTAFKRKKRDTRRIRGLREGTAEMTMTTYNGKSTTFKVTVVAKPQTVTIGGWG